MHCQEEIARVFESLTAMRLGYQAALRLAETLAAAEPGDGDLHAIQEMCQLIQQVQDASGALQNAADLWDRISGLPSASHVMALRDEVTGLADAVIARVDQVLAGRRNRLSDLKPHLDQERNRRRMVEAYGLPRTS